MNNHYKEEAYLICNGRVIKYIPLQRMGDTYGMKIKKNQSDFKHFDFLFSTDNPELYTEVDYLLPGGKKLAELPFSDFGYLSGTLNLQLKDSKDYDDWVLYDFYIHGVKDRPKEPEDILKSMMRKLNIDNLLE